MSKPETNWSIPQRQGGPALLIIIFKTIIELLKGFWPIAIAILFTGKSDRANIIQLFIIAFFALVLIRSMIEFYFFRFQIINNELIVRKGFLTKRKITLPLERIIAVHIEQSWLHRIFDAVQVSFDSAGTEKTEAVIKAIPLNKAKSLRKFITETRPEGITVEKEQAPAYQEEPIITLSGKDLLKLCISANHIEGLFLLLAFVISVIDNISEATGNETTGILSWVYERIDIGSLSGILFLFILFVLISIVVSGIRVLLRYSNFRIIRSEKGFSIRSGLIDTKEKLISFRKIQYLSWKANWLRKKIGIYLVRFHVAGTSKIKERMEVKVPATQQRFITEILKDYHDRLPVNDLKPVRIQKAYIIRKIMINGVLLSICLFGISWFMISQSAFLFFLIIPYVALSSWLYQRKFRLWAIAEALQVQKGIFGSDEVIMIWNKVQSIQLAQSLYQRRKKLATLKLFTAGGVLTIPFIKEQEATHIFNYALYKTESGNKNWM